MGSIAISKNAHDVRKRIVDDCQFLLDHNPQISYEQRRPIPYNSINQHGGQPFDIKKLSPIDCSGSSILVVREAGEHVLADDHDRHKLFCFKGIYDHGQGWTGSLVNDLKHVPRRSARPGDFVLFPGHVVVLLQRADKIDRSRPHLSFHYRNPLVESMGQDADPSKFSLDTLDAYFPGGVTFLKTVPDDL